MVRGTWGAIAHAGRLTLARPVVDDPAQLAEPMRRFPSEFRQRRWRRTRIEVTQSRSADSAVHRNSGIPTAGPPL